MLVRRGHCSHSANRCTEFQRCVCCSNRIWLHKIIENRVTIECDHALLCSSTIQPHFITKVSLLILCLCAAITISSACVNVGSIHDRHAAFLSRTPDNDSCNVQRRLIANSNARSPHQHNMPVDPQTARGCISRFLAIW